MQNVLKNKGSHRQAVWFHGLDVLIPTLIFSLNSTLLLLLPLTQWKNLLVVGLMIPFLPLYFWLNNLSAPDGLQFA